MRPLRDAALAGCGLLLLYGMQQTQPSYAQITGPFVTSGEVKKPASTGLFQAEVTGFKAAKRLIAPGAKTSILTTEGIWVLVAVKARALSGSLTLSSASWQGPSLARYYATDRLPPSLTQLNSERLEPGLEAQGLLVFEIPRSELDGATLRLSSNRFTPLGSELAIVIPAFEDDKIVEQFDLTP